MQNMLQYYIVNREKKPLCLEVHAVMKMADLTAFCQTKWMFMDLMILSNFSQIFLKQNQLDYVV